jgi:hypothetical protein
MLAAMRRFVGSLVLVALFASPTVARARMFCRYTGVEITDCGDRCPSETPAIRDAGCCEERTVQPLPVSRVTDQQVSVTPLVAAAPLPRATDIARHCAAEPSPPVAASGPPLYVAQRALLI